MSDRYQPVHAYGGLEHDQPAPVVGCLLCRLDYVIAWADRRTRERDDLAVAVQRYIDLDAQHQRRVDTSELRDALARIEKAAPEGTAST